MPLTITSPTYFHVLQNLSLILLAVFFAPFCTGFAISSTLISPFTKTSKHIKHHRQWRQKSSSTFKPRTVLVTGVGMSKGLALARAFHRAGHNVIGADFEPYLIPVSGHFSLSISKFYRLSKPTGSVGTATYIRDLLSIISEEKVELWVSCSGVASALEDGEAAEVVLKESKCVPIQFGVTLTETLHEKDSFISNTRKLGLNVPITHLVTSETEALHSLYPTSPRLEKPLSPRERHKYIMKPVEMDDSTRADMTLLPLPTLKETELHIRRLNPTPFRPFVLQQFISGPEYCTHSLILRGKVKCFVACPSSDFLMRCVALPTTSALSLSMQRYTSIYAEKTGKNMTGHFSLDFLVPEHIARRAKNMFGVSEDEVRDIMKYLYPIECNPRAHTAVVLFSDESEDLASSYLSILPSHEPAGITNGHRDTTHIVVPKPSVPGYYWISHDIVALFFLPMLALVRGEIDIGKLLGKWVEFLGHVLFWREGTWEIWDPWPWWWSCVGYWPAMFAVRLWERRWWSRCNVSTGKLFGC
ncbi:hypothetical protein G7Y89_g1927 [Cudoniella acicularis]|uniref:ATP-grasp domain-containing protein n=1 Tax=Cudoniella acicularis TaxID=354080 RepID=A0A8H4RX96_9HELO|nr:hypothetical protein G7Y89_g1927 [Cudoniella acicularis]